MNLLSMDTSTRHLSLAVSRGDQIARFRNTKLSRPLSSSIMPGIRRVLKDSGLPLADIDGLAVGLGPGSFTSLRVGLSTVKGLALATGKPVVGISSLDILAMGAGGEDGGQVCALVDAKRNLVYACLYERDGAALKKTSEYLLTDIQDVLKRIQGKAVFTGDGAVLFQEVIQQNKKKDAVFAGPRQMCPQARHMLSLALSRFQTGRTDDIDRLVPLYLYPRDCQVNPKR
jgi:tRNA threonylcarbamoyladenosine biosynthesis protein TsaB